jgi:hypothetical protein
VRGNSAASVVAAHTPPAAAGFPAKLKINPALMPPSTSARIARFTSWDLFAIESLSVISSRSRPGLVGATIAPPRFRSLNVGPQEVCAKNLRPNWLRQAIFP